jgi:hypothetical protein
MFKINEAISFQVNCETQERWIITGANSLSAGMKKRKCATDSRTNTACLGRLFRGVLIEMINDPDTEKSQRVMQAIQMKRSTSRN